MNVDIDMATEAILLEQDRELKEQGKLPEIDKGQSGLEIIWDPKRRDREKSKNEW